MAWQGPAGGVRDGELLGHQVRHETYSAPSLNALNSRSAPEIEPVLEAAEEDDSRIGQPQPAPLAEASSGMRSSTSVEFLSQETSELHSHSLPVHSVGLNYWQGPLRRAVYSAAPAQSTVMRTIPLTTESLRAKFDPA